jgi:hypothetical protein
MRINQLRRREFITLFSSAALGWPLIAQAQQVPAEMGAEKATVTLAHGGVRHTTIPESFWGSWVPGTDACKNADKSVIVLSATTYVTPEANCTVEWMAETAGARGPIYSVHIQCSKRSGKAQSTISERPYYFAEKRQPDFARLRVRQPQNLPKVFRQRARANAIITQGNATLEALELWRWRHSAQLNAPSCTKQQIMDGRSPRWLKMAVAHSREPFCASPQNRSLRSELDQMRR